jgi:hypothetical protein
MEKQLSQPEAVKRWNMMLPAFTNTVSGPLSNAAINYDSN